MKDSPVNGTSVTVRRAMSGRRGNAEATRRTAGCAVKASHKLPLGEQCFTVDANLPKARARARRQYNRGPGLPCLRRLGPVSQGTVWPDRVVVLRPPTRLQDGPRPSLRWVTVSPMENPEGRHLAVHERVVRAMLRQFPMSSDPAMAATMKPMPTCIATR